MSNRWPICSRCFSGACCAVCRNYLSYCKVWNFTHFIMKLPLTYPEVPPFDGKTKKTIIRFTWWSWHPLYPYWSKSCWGGTTEQEAIDSRKIKSGGDWLEVYHNKLIRENDDGTLTEVLDSPCQRLDVWERCLKLKNLKL